MVESSYNLETLYVVEIALKTWFLDNLDKDLIHGVNLVHGTNLVHGRLNS